MAQTTSKKKVKNYQVVLLFVLVLWLNSLLPVLYVALFPPLGTPLMHYRNIEKVIEGEWPKVHYEWKKYDRINPSMFKALLAAEDQKFFQHHGFDWNAIRKAYEGNKKGKRIKGGSTISQQTAKNLFCWPARSYTRKAVEAYYTFWMELFCSKKRILTLYLNIIEFGDGIYGIGEASKIYYKKEAKDLNRYEAALLTACVPSPLTRDPRKPTAYLRKRQSWIMRQMNYISID